MKHIILGNWSLLTRKKVTKIGTVLIIWVQILKIKHKKRIILRKTMRKNNI